MKSIKKLFKLKSKKEKPLKSQGVPSFSNPPPSLVQPSTFRLTNNAIPTPSTISPPNNEASQPESGPALGYDATPNGDVVKSKRAKRRQNSSTHPIVDTSKTKRPPKIHSAEDLKQAADKKFKNMEYDEAVRLYTRALAQHPSSGLKALLYENRAETYMELGRFTLAIEDWRALTQMQPHNKNPEYFNRFARCYLALASPDIAQDILGRALVLDPQNQISLDLLAEAKSLQDKTTNLEEAITRRDWKVVIESVGDCIRSIGAEGADVPFQWRIWRIEAELKSGNWEGANTESRIAAELYYDVGNIHRLRGHVLFLGGQLYEGLQSTRKAVDLFGSHDLSKAQRDRIVKIRLSQENGDADMRERRLYTAIENYTKALKLLGESEEDCMGGPLRAIFLYIRGAIHVELFQYQEALLDMNAALSLIPDSFTGLKKFQVLRMRALIKFHLVRYKEGMDDLQLAIQQAPDYDDLKILKEEWSMMESRLKYDLDDICTQVFVQCDAIRVRNVVPMSEKHDAIVYGLQPRRFKGPRIDWAGKIGYQH